MGLAAYGTVTLRDTSGHTFRGDISEVFDWLEHNNIITRDEIIKFDEYTEYVDLSNKDLEITDFTVESGWTKVKKFLRCTDPHLRWRKLTFSVSPYLSITLKLTHDHPLSIAYESTSMFDFHRVKVDDMIDIDRENIYGLYHHDDTVEPIELTNVEFFHQNYTEKLIGYDFETESDKFELQSIASHNCRTRVIGNYHDPSRQIVPGRGNLFVVTMNLPWLALETKESLKPGEDLYTKFLEDVDETIDKCIDQLNDRFEMVAKRTGKNFPFLIGQGAYLDSEKIGPDDSVREVMLHGTRTIGFIGLAETLIALFGKHHAESEFAQEKGLEIIKHMNDRISSYARKTNINYSFMGSPAEGCTGRLCRLLRKRFGVIPRITDKEFLTNSHHCPVDYPLSAYDKVKIEAPYHALEPAG